MEQVVISPEFAVNLEMSLGFGFGSIFWLLVFFVLFRR